MSPHLQFLEAIIFSNLLALLVGGLFIFFVNAYNKKGNRIELPVSNGVLLLIIAYGLSVAAITIVPLPYSEGLKHPKLAINLLPFVHTFENLFDPTKRQHNIVATDVAQNIIGNILMFLPLGILLPLANPKFKSIKKIIVFAVLSSAAIEVTQFCSRVIGNYRQTDIDDVIFNTIGALLGYLLYKKLFATERTPFPATHAS